MSKFRDQAVPSRRQAYLSLKDHLEKLDCALQVGRGRPGPSNAGPDAEVVIGGWTETNGVFASLVGVRRDDHLGLCRRSAQATVRRPYPAFFLASKPERNCQSV
jgi:hypothetical protein